MTDIRLHAIQHGSRANGPGLRSVVWFQGCTIGCPGCFNPETHAPKAGFTATTEALAREITAHSKCTEGVTISGGEPFQQSAALLDLLERLAGTQLSRLVFTGYALDEVRHLPLGPRILDAVDVLIAGRYVASRHLGRGLRGC